MSIRDWLLHSGHDFFCSAGTRETWDGLPERLQIRLSFTLSYTLYPLFSTSTAIPGNHRCQWRNFRACTSSPAWNLRTNELLSIASQVFPNYKLNGREDSRVRGCLFRRRKLDDSLTAGWGVVRLDRRKLHSSSSTEERRRGHFLHLLFKISCVTLISPTSGEASEC